MHNVKVLLVYDLICTPAWLSAIHFNKVQICALDRQISNHKPFFFLLFFFFIHLRKVKKKKKRPLRLLVREREGLKDSGSWKSSLWHKEMIHGKLHWSRFNLICVFTLVQDSFICKLHTYSTDFSKVHLYVCLCTCSIDLFKIHLHVYYTPAE